MKKYQLTINTWLLEDRASVNFHVKNADYFGTIASILTIVKDKLTDLSKKEQKLIIKVLENLITDCLYLQTAYSIIPKKKNQEKSPTGKEINQ